MSHHRDESMGVGWAPMLVSSVHAASGLFSGSWSTARALTFNCEVYKNHRKKENKNKSANDGVVSTAPPVSGETSEALTRCFPMKAERNPVLSEGEHPLPSPHTHLVCVLCRFTCDGWRTSPPFGALTPMFPFPPFAAPLPPSLSLSREAL